MNSLRKRITIALLLMIGLLAGSAAGATPIVMDFDGLATFTSVHTYYDGGCTTVLGFGVDCHGPDDGVVWKHASVEYDTNAPSSPGFAVLLSDHATMNVAAGFDSALSFDYYSYNFLSSASVSVYSEQNGHGTRLARARLESSGDWNFFDLNFDGLGKSVIFRGLPFLTGFDNVTLGMNSPNTNVPEPAELGMFGLGVLLMGLFSALRHRRERA